MIMIWHDDDVAVNKLMDKIMDNFFFNTLASFISYIYAELEIF